MSKSATGDWEVLSDMMRRFWISFGHKLNEEVEARGINSSQYTTLVALAAKGDCRMTELSDSLHVTMGAMTAIVDKLLRGGYVMRSRGTEDRRVVIVRIEPQGQQLVQEIDGKLTGLMLGVLGTVEASRRRAFVESYRMMVGSIEALEPPKVRASDLDPLIPMAPERP